MGCASEPLVLVFRECVVYSLVRAAKHTFSCFGGPLEMSVTGRRLGRRPLHKIAHISDQHVPLSGSSRYVSDIPLIYGMRYSGCSLKYKFKFREINILELDPPQSSEDWPYKGYPKILPYAPLELGARNETSWTVFADAFPNLPKQQPTELVAVVPPPMTMGVSLWGADGDAEGVAIVFEVDLDANKVAAYNVCS